MKIQKKHIGRPGAFTGYDGGTYYGRITNVRRGIITIVYTMPGKAEEVTGYIPAKENRVIAY